MPDEAHRLPVSPPPVRHGRRGSGPRIPRGTASLTLKLFVGIATAALVGWAALLPEDDEYMPFGWSLLLAAVVLAALAVPVLRLAGRGRALVPFLRGLRGGDEPSERARRRLDVIDGWLVALQVAGVALTLVGLVIVVVLAAFWDTTIPVAVGLTPFCVAIAARLGRWAIGRADFPDGGM